MERSRSGWKLARAAVVGAIGAIALLVGGTLPALGFHDPAPLLDERHIEGPFWIAHRVAVEQPGTTVGYELANPTSENRHQVAYGLWTMRVGQEKPHFFVVGSGGTRTTEADIQWQDPVPIDADIDPLVGSSGETNGFGLTHDDLAIGDYWLVVASTAPWQKSANVRLFGTEGVRILATAQGEEGTLYRESDFETQDPHHHIRTGAVTFTAQTHELRNAHIDYTIHHNLFGLFRESGGDPGDVSILQPDGTERGEGVLSGLSAGDYRFKVNEWVVPPRAALGPDAYIAVLLADVRLPEAEREATTLELVVEGDQESVATTATLRSGAGIPLAGKAIVFAHEGDDPQTLITDELGLARFILSRNDFRPGESVKASFAGDEKYEPSASSATFSPRP